MKLVLAGLVLVLVVGAQAQWYKYSRKAVRFTKEAFQDTREATWKTSHRYFHNRDNYDAARRGPGGRWTAKVISDVLQSFLGSSAHGHKDSTADQRANLWAYNGGDLKNYRPKALPTKY